MKTTFQAAWWRGHVPQDWEISEDDACVTFQSPRSAGALQVSAVAKDDGQVTDDDLLDFASERIDERDVKHVRTPDFQGIYVESIRDGDACREWWLRGGHLMVYVTYIVGIESRDVDRSAVDEFVRTLQPRHS